jgi:hypothetical protein
MLEAAARDILGNPDRLRVPDKLNHPHPVIEQWLTEHRELKRRDQLEESPYHVPVRDWTPSDHRKHRILSTIFRAVEGYGLLPRSDRRSTFHFQYRNRTIRCSLQIKRRAGREKPPADPEAPAESLVFSIDEYLDPEHDLKRKWADMPTSRLEDAVPDIAATLLLTGSALIAMQRAREEQELLQLNTNRAAELEMADRRKAENQWRLLVECADRFETATRVGRFIKALEVAGANSSERVGDRALAEWLTWAKGRVKEYDQLARDPVQVFEEIAKVTEWTFRD